MYASGASTPARLAIGSSGQVLTVSGGLPAWATPGSGGSTLICTHTVSVAQSSIDTNTVIGGVIPTSYKHLLLVAQGLSTHADTAVPTLLRFNNDSGANYYDQRTYSSATTVAADESIGATAGRIGNFPGSTATQKLSSIQVLIPNYNGTTFKKSWSSEAFHASNKTTGTLQAVQIGGLWDSSAAITRLAIHSNSGNLDVGTVFSLYGLA